MAAPNDLVKLPACVAGGRSEAGRALRPDQGSARSDPGWGRTWMVLVAATRSFRRPRRAVRLLRGALVGARAGREPDTRSPVRHWCDARRGDRLTASCVLSGARGVPAVRPGQEPGEALPPPPRPPRPLFPVVALASVRLAL